MKAIALLALGFALGLTTVTDASATRRSRDLGPLDIVEYSPHAVQIGGRNGFAKAATDSFNLYGGVRSDGSNDRRPEGLFQTVDFIPDSQSWTSVDLTQNPVRWHVSQFNAGNLDAIANNNAMFCGVEAGEPGFTTAPGYGNNYNDNLDWFGFTNPAQNTNVRLEFDFNHDTEPGYDFFHVQYDSGGVMVDWLVQDGTNKDASGIFTAPVHFDESELFTPPMYVGNPPFLVHLRLKVTSDGAWSDEDGLWPTKGAAQVDNIRVYFNGGLVSQAGDDGVATFEDLGGGTPDTEGWAPAAADFVGDFAKVVPQLRDTDPCRTNISPQLGFLDDGSAPNNAPGESTGGQTSPNWSYGAPGGWVVNYNGGLTLGVQALNNEWRSPEIDWDDTSSTEDDGLIGGAFLRFSVWQHLPLNNGIFWTWSVRSRDAGTWTPWVNRNFVYYGDNGGTYTNVQPDVTDLLVNDPQQVQIALGVADLSAVFAFPGTDATPSPTFDAVSFWRYDLGGPAFATRNIDLFQDGFPTTGETDPDLNPADMYVRIDMARDISTGIQNLPGDSIIVDVVPTVPGTSLDGAPVMKWILEANPAFDAVRTIPAGAANWGTAANGFTRWFGTVTGDSSRTASGASVADRFYFDMPGDGPALAPYQTAESPMFFPGDRIRYFLEATDTGFNTTTLPPDTTGFASGELYSRVFTVRALPTLTDDGGGFDQPNILVINDFGHRGGENDFLGAFGQNGLAEDIDFDTYTVRGPSSLVSNGIGSSGAHGATGPQLGGYDCLVYLSGNLSSGLLSDGTNANGNDKGDDLGTLNAWQNLPGDRFAVYFGDELATDLNRSVAGQTYLQTIMGVQYNDADIKDEIGGHFVPIVQPTGAHPSFAASYIAFGGCLAINNFDSIQPNVSPFSVSTHEFTDGTTTFAPSAAVWHDRTTIIDSTPYRRVDMTFPYGFIYVWDLIPNTYGGLSSRSVLLGEILQGFGHQLGPAVGADPINNLKFGVEPNRPNPFNPSTTIRFTAPTRGPVSVKVYNVRGELVTTLHEGEVDPGQHAVEWNGRDSRGAQVGSGIYLYAVEGFGERVTRKMALVK